MITFINHDVGSGIEYIGNIFLNWTKELYLTSVISNQNPPILIYKELIEQNPNIIILNEYYERTLEAISFYKSSFPKTKIIFINHSSKLVDNKKNDRNIAIRELYNKIDVKIGLNSKGGKDVIDFEYMPVNPEIYKIKTSWKDRKKDFIILGNINNQKISSKFIKKNKVKMDCYGINNGDYEVFNNDKNLKYISKLEQEKVPEVLNEYKYAIFPFGGKEIFSISILQSILCGTIPIVLNDSGNNWTKWTDGFVYLSDNVNTFCNNIEKLSKNTEILNFENVRISAVEKFNYLNLKEKYQKIIKTL